MADRFLQIKLSDEEFDRLNERARQAGKTVQNYIRSIALLEEKPLGPEYGAKPAAPKVAITPRKAEEKKSGKRKGRVQEKPESHEGASGNAE